MNGFYYKLYLKKFFGRHISIKFLGNRNLLHKNHKNDGNIHHNKGNFLNILVNNELPKINNNNVCTTFKVESKNINSSKISSGLFNDFKRNFNNITSDTDILRPILSKESIEEINFGANINVSDWNKITFNKKH